MNEKSIHVYNKEGEEIFKENMDATIQVIDGCLLLLRGDKFIAIFAAGCWGSVEVW